MSEQTKKGELSLQGYMVRGSFWTMAMRATTRLTSLTSTVILARLLQPTDFGIVAIAMLIVGGVEIFSAAGQRAAIVRYIDPTLDHYDTAWTVSVLLGLFLATIIWTTAPYAAVYFKTPQVVIVARILAFRTALSGFENIGTVNFQRGLRFNKTYQFIVSAKLTSFSITVIAAFVLRNYWALVIGIMMEEIAAVTLSYAMEPHRPRFTLVKIRDISSFSIWNLAKSIGGYVYRHIEKPLIGNFAGAPAMGRYSVAYDLTTLPSEELINPVVTALFPVMVKVQREPVKRTEIYLSVLYWSALLCVSTSVGICLVGDDMVDLVLGPKWVDVKPIVPWLALSFGLVAMSSNVYAALDSTGRAATSAGLQWVRLAGLAGIVLPVAYYFKDLETIAMGRFWATLLMTPTLFFTLAKALEIPIGEILMTLVWPLISGLMMALVVGGANMVIPFHGPPRLAIDITLGGLVFISSLMALWHLRGRPSGPEAQFWQRLHGLLKR
jgi:lipopolysaccharide exporter